MHITGSWQYRYLAPAVQARSSNVGVAWVWGKNRDVTINMEADSVCLSVVLLLCATPLCLGQETISLPGSSTCQNVTLEPDYDPTSPLVLCCLL